MVFDTLRRFDNFISTFFVSSDEIPISMRNVKHPVHYRGDTEPVCVFDVDDERPDWVKDEQMVEDVVFYDQNRFAFFDDPLAHETRSILCESVLGDYVSETKKCLSSLESKVEFSMNCEGDYFATFCNRNSGSTVRICRHKRAYSTRIEVLNEIPLSFFVKTPSEISAKLQMSESFLCA